MEDQKRDSWRADAYSLLSSLGYLCLAGPTILPFHNKTNCEYHVLFRFRFLVETLPRATCSGGADKRLKHREAARNWNAQCCVPSCRNFALSANCASRSRAPPRPSPLRLHTTLSRPIPLELSNMPLPNPAYCAFSHACCNILPPQNRRIPACCNIMPQNRRTPG